MRPHLSKLSTLFLLLVVFAVGISASQKTTHAAVLNEDAVAVIIGNKTYGGKIPEVSFAHNDAEAMKRFVIEGLGFRKGNIIDLRDATRAELDTVFGNDKTHEGKLFDWIRPGESDVVVFYSGHGVPGLKDKRAYLLPVDGDANRAEISGYSVETLYQNLGKLQARSIRVFIDACFSGETPKGMVIRAASGISVVPKTPKSVSRLVTLTAAQGDQLASWDEDARLGLFTKHVLEALYGAADTAKYGDGNGRVSLAEVGKYLDREMSYQARRRFGRRQNASLTGSGATILVPEIVKSRPKTGSPRKQTASVTTSTTGSKLKPKPSPLVKPAVGVYAGGTQPGTVFRDCPDCPEMVVMPTGSFAMGSRAGGKDEKPVYQVSFGYPFAVGKYEVTQVQWQAVMGSNPSRFKGDHRPVEGVSWKDAQEFLRKLTAKTGRTYRLLSEAEWEYVARAGAKTKFWWGNGIDSGKSNYRRQVGETTPVGRYPANAFGLYDVHGNVWEWVADCWNESYFNAPNDGLARATGECDYRVLRGGSWFDESRALRLTKRYRSKISFRSKFNGFRVASTLPQ